MDMLLQHIRRTIPGSRIDAQPRPDIVEMPMRGLFLALRSRVCVSLGLTLGLAALMPATVLAQPKDFPMRPLKIVVPFTTGSTSDAASRFFAEQLTSELGQQVLVENRTGANGVIAIQALLSAPADGHTLLLGAISLLSINPIAVKNLPYDPVRDLKPISGIARGMNVFVVPADADMRTLADLVARAKTRAQPLNLGSFAPGYFLSAEWFARLAGITFNPVPYKGQAPILTDLVGNQLDLALVDLGGALPLLKSGKVRAVAVTGETRHPEMPDVPTVRESGYPEFVRYSWGGFYVRADTPDALTNRLADAMQNVLARPQSKQFAARQAQELMPYRPAEMLKFQLDELERMRKVADAIGFKPQ